MNYSEFKKAVESCHINLLVGSGSSRPFLDTLQNIEILLTKLENSSLDNDKKKILECLLKRYYTNTCISGNLKLIDQNFTTPKLEVTKKNYSDFINSLHAILAKRRTNLVSKQINIFTSNMDIFHEYTIEKNQHAYNDGFIGRINPTYGTENFHGMITKTSTHYEYQSEIPLFNLFKLHGSVNWMQNGEKITYDIDLSILKELTSIEIPEEDLIDVEFEDGGEVRLKDLDELVSALDESSIDIKEVHRKYLEAYDKIVMINPTKKKFETTTRDLTFYELLRMYSNHLERENSILFVIGFSFADEHIREITRRVIKSNPTLLVVIFCYTKDSKNSINKFLGDQSNVKYIFSDDDSINYSLDKINEYYFGRLANELESPNKRVGEGLNPVDLGNEEGDEELNS